MKTLIMKINFQQLYNLFGNTLPEKHVFFNTRSNTVTRVMLRKVYGRHGSDFYRYRKLCKDYAAFVVSLRKAKPKVEMSDEAK